MANPEHLAILRQGVEVWNRWRGKNPDINEFDLRDADLTRANLAEANLYMAHLNSADLGGANLHRADLNLAHLCGANLSRANLSLAVLRGADLNGTKFNGADLNGAGLQWAHLTAADLTQANLCRADLDSADLNGANLHGANLLAANITEAILNEANFVDAQMGKTILGAIDLSQVLNLDHVQHLFPSSIDIDTIFKSQGKIPDSFLRGAGVPEDFITYLPSFFAQPFQYYSCFISHSSHDQPFCQRLHADLQAKKVRTWYFPEDAKWGRPVWGEIDQSIRIYDKLVVVCSEASLQSGPVLREIERALNREDREGKEVLFPIRLDGFIFETWDHPRKADLLAKVVGDFSNWKDHDAYQQAFDRLLAALQAGG